MAPKKHTYTIPAEVANVAKTLEGKGFEAYLIGGCVRDLILGKKPKDWDITTNAKPDEIIASFPNTFYENDYGTVGVVTEEAGDETLKVVEVTPYRLESAYSDNRRPDSVSFSSTLEDDLKRRDFTFNAIALRLTKETGKDTYGAALTDLFGGQKDLEDGIIRTVGKPLDRFKEDALRILRAVRLAAELGFTIEQATEKAIVETAHSLKNIAKERIRDEFIRIIMSDRPMEGLQLAHKLDLLGHILPELEEGIGVEQNQAHAFDVWEHTLRTVQHGAKKNFSLEIRLASLFHDIGKPRTREWSNEKKEWTFYGHDVVGARISERALTNLRFPKKTIEIVGKLVRWHMFFSDTEQITLSAVRRLVTKVGPEHIWDLMNLRVCDRVGTGRPKENPYRLRKYKSMIEEVLRDPISVGMLKIEGGTLMKIANLEPGPKIGQILHALLEEVLENPALNTKEYLEKRAIELAILPENELKDLGEKGKERRKEEEEKELKEIRKRHWVE